METLIFYDADGNVVATLDSMIARDDAGNVTGQLDFIAHEAAKGDMTDIGSVAGAKSSGTWPEWIGGAKAAEFRVEMDPKPGPARARIRALVHKKSGHRRERVAIEAAITAVVPNTDGAKDIRHLVGGPDRPLCLDDKGRTTKRPANAGTPKHLPIVGQV